MQLLDGVLGQIYLTICFSDRSYLAHIPKKRMNSLSVVFRERIEEDIALFFYCELAVFSFGKENSCLVNVK